MKMVVGMVEWGYGLEEKEETVLRVLCRMICLSDNWRAASAVAGAETISGSFLCEDEMLSTSSPWKKGRSV